MKSYWLVETEKVVLCVISIFVHCFFTPVRVLFYKKLHEKRIEIL